MIDREHELAKFILGLVPINNLGTHQQDQALQAGELFEYKKKKIIFESGSRDPYTYYLIDGELALESAEASPLQVSAGSEQAQRALAQLQPRRYTARTTSAVIMYRIERAVLDQLLTEEQELEGESSVEVSDLEDDTDDGDWMSRLLSSELFTRLPHDNIQRFFTQLEPLPAEAGDVIVEQGSQGKFLYIVAEGKCSVNRVAPRSEQELQLAILNEGDTFGEESLISNSPCNASVKVLESGFLMRLPKHSFEELVTKATIKPLTWSEACKQVEDGARWLDVRFSDEHDQNAIEDSVNMPLNTLRLDSKNLDAERSYIVYCDTGARSSTGAFLMARMGFESYYLAGGLDRSPLGPEVGLATDISQARPVAKDAPAEAAVDSHESSEESTSTAGFEFEIVTDNQTRLTDPTPEAATQDSPPAAQPKPAAGKRDTPAAAPQATAAPPKSRPSSAAPETPDQSVLQEQLKTLRTERDKAATYARKGAEKVKELKGRYEELRQAAVAERSRREALERELADKQAAAQRQLEMEKSRFSSELEKARKKIEETGQSAAALEQQLQGSRQELQQAQKQNQQLEEAKVAFEVAYEDNLASLREQVQAKQARVEQAETDLKTFRAEVKEQLTSTQQAIRIKEAEASQLEAAVQSVESHLQEQKLQLEAEQTRFEEELKQAESRHNEAEAGLRADKAKLDTESAVQGKRAASLEQREMDLADRAAGHEAKIAKREEAISQQELELSEERASWQEQIDAAIAQERERLEKSFAEQQQTSELMDPEAAEAMAEQRCEEVRTESEALAVAAKAEFEAQLANAQNSAERQLSELRESYEAKFVEQDALRGDEHRQLATENLHLRDALTEAQRIIKSNKAETTPLEPSSGPDLTLDLEPEKPAAVSAPPPAPSDVPVIEMPEEAASVPLIEMPEEPEEPEEPAQTASEDNKQRIISPKQLAEIRKKMQEKLAAHRK